MLRIGIVADQIHRRSGVGVYSRALLRALAKSGRFEYVVAFPGAQGAQELGHLVPEMRNCTLPPRALLYPTWHAVGHPRLERFLGEVDLVHVLAGSVTTPTRCPRLVTVHCMDSMRHPADHMWRRRWLKHRMLRRMGPSGTHVLAVSRAVEADMREMVADVPPERMHMIHCGLDRELFRPSQDEERERTRLGLPPRYFLFLGVITPRENVGNLCRAFQRYVEAGGEADLVMAGAPDGSGEDVPAQSCTGAALARIHRLGYVPHDSLPALYAGARALVYPSRYEGFGLPMLEAMACGTPVLAARAGALPEVAGDAALFFDPADVQGIADSMLRVDRDGEVADTLRTRGHARATQFDWATVAARVEELYERICTGGG